MQRPTTSIAQRGVTLIEIMVVLAIIGGLMIVLLGDGLFKSRTTRLREASVEVMATLRAAYNMATLSGKHHRVVFNLEEQGYHIEVCEGVQTLKKGDEEETVDADALQELKERIENPVTSDMESEIVQADSPEEAAAAAAALAGMRVGSSRCVPAPESISGQPTKNGNRHRIESGFEISELFVQHLSDGIEEGIASINFFPTGNAEKAVIKLEGKGVDETFWVIVHGMTGRVEFSPDEVDVDEHMHHNAEGDEEAER